MRKEVWSTEPNLLPAKKYVWGKIFHLYLKKIHANKEAYSEWDGNMRKGNGGKQLAKATARLSKGKLKLASPSSLDQSFHK